MLIPKSSIQELVQKYQKLPTGSQQQVITFVEFLLEKHLDNFDLENKENTLRTEESPRRCLGLNRGQIWMSSDFDESLPDEFWLCEM